MDFNCSIQIVILLYVKMCGYCEETWIDSIFIFISTMSIESCGGMNCAFHIRKRPVVIKVRA